MSLTAPENLTFIRSQDRLCGILIWDIDSSDPGIYYEISYNNLGIDAGYTTLNTQAVVSSASRQIYITGDILRDAETYYFRVRSYIYGTDTYSDYSYVNGCL